MAKTSEASPWPGLLASSTAGMIARLTCHPLDTCKAILQVQHSKKHAAVTGGQVGYSNFVHVLRATLQREGIVGLYRGFGVAFFGGAPGLCLYLSSYEKSKSWLGSFSYFQEQPAMSHFVSGMTAEAFSCVLFVPIDITKERLQIQGMGGGTTFNYKGNMDAIRQIWRHEGLRGVYKGYGATLLSFGPFSAFYFTFYEQLKAQSLVLTRTHPNDVPFIQHMLNSVLAGMAASFVTNPLDLVKLRLQVQRSGIASGGGDMLPWGRPYRHLFDGLSQIVKTEGTSALLKGVGARMAFHGPATAISMACYESLKSEFTPYF